MGRAGVCLYEEFRGWAPAVGWFTILECIGNVMFCGMTLLCLCVPIHNDVHSRSIS
jgi:hypothetical protein